MPLFAFALMLSHLHTILNPREHSIGKLLDEFDSFTIHAILNQLRQDNEKELLEFLASQRRDRHIKHGIWQDIQAKNVFSIKFLNRNIEYVHNNPVAKEWKLVEHRADYRYSSVCFYDRNVPPIIEVDDIRDYL